MKTFNISLSCDTKKAVEQLTAMSNAIIKIDLLYANYYNKKLNFDNIAVLYSDTIKSYIDNDITLKEVIIFLHSKISE